MTEQGRQGRRPGARSARPRFGAWQVAGYLLWRGGLLVAAAGTLFWLWRWLLAAWLLPGEVTAGVALMLTGFLLVLASLLLERLRDDEAA